MKYLCLIYDEEKKLAAMPQSESDAFMGEYFAFTEGIQQERPLPRRRGAAAGPDRHDGPDPERQGLHHRRAVRRDQGAARRLLPDRGQGPERGDPGRGQDPLGEARQRRGAAGRGVRSAVGNAFVILSGAKDRVASGPARAALACPTRSFAPLDDVLTPDAMSSEDPPLPPAPPSTPSTAPTRAACWPP